MAIPATITTRNVHIDIRNSDGSASSGTILFLNAYALRDDAGSLILSPGTYTATLSSGEATIALPVNDDGDVTPTGWTYTVVVSTTGWSEIFDIEVPTGDSSTLELSDIAPAVSTPSVVTYALNSALNTEITNRTTADSTHAALTTTVHGISDTSALETQTGAQDKVDTLETALAAVYLALTGGTLTGDLLIQGSDKAYRFRRGGSALDLEATGVDLLISNWSGTAFDGTQRSYARLSADALNTQWAGRVESVAALYGSSVHALDPNTGIGEIGGKNSLAAIRFAGFKATSGAPSTDTWIAGDLVLDSDGAWHLCTVGGTPGTWT